MAFPVSARTTGELITAAIWNADLKDNLNNVKTGAQALDQVQFGGQASDPTVSSSGFAIEYFNTTGAEMRRSVNGSTYESQGSELFRQMMSM